MTDPFEPSPFMPAVSKEFDSVVDMMTSRQQRGQTDADSSVAFPTIEKENNTKESNVAKIRVVVCYF